MCFLGQRHKSLFLTALVMAMALATTSAFSQNMQAQVSPNISAKIESLAEEKQSIVRHQLAEDLLVSVRRVGAKNVTENQILALIELFNEPEDSAREPIATILGLIGARAIRAVPALEAAYRHDACISRNMKSARLFRSAISRIGASALPIKCPIVANGYTSSVSITVFNREHSSTFVGILPGECVEIDPEEFLLTKLIVVSKQLPAKAYAAKEFNAALENKHFANGVLMTNEAGISYVQGYNCSNSK